MEIINKILEFIKKNSTLVLSISLVIVCFLYFKQCNKNNQNDTIQNQNLHALHDTVVKYVNKGGEVSYQKAIMEMSKSDLKKYNPDLYNDVLKDKDVKVITKTEYVYRDTGSVKNRLVELKDNNFSLPFDYTSTDSILKIKGESSFNATSYLDGDKAKLKILPGYTCFDDTRVQFGLKIGIKKDKNLNKIFVTPTTPNGSTTDKLTVTSIDGADVSNLLNPKKKKFCVGPYVGYGINFSKGLVNYGPSIGVSLQYKIIQF